MFFVKEIFPTMQGEGSKSGCPAVFLRFSGCNLWSGHEKTRTKAKGHCGLWCDTDFINGTKYSELDIITALEDHVQTWKEKTLVITGGEPLLQLKKEKGISLITKLFNLGWNICIETNGTISNNVTDLLLSHSCGHITVSPKPLMTKESSFDHVKLRKGTDLKIIIPTYFDLEQLRSWSFDNFYLQPMDEHDGTIGNSNLQEAYELCCKHGFILSVQTHKFVGME